MDRTLDRTMTLKTDIFPLNYVKSIWTPLTAFKNRFELKGWMMFILVLFLNALLVIPVTLNYAGMDSFPLDEYYPNATKMINEEVVSELNQVDIEEGQLFVHTPFHIKTAYGEVAGGLSEEEADAITSPNFLIFEQNQLIIGEEGLPTSTVLYTRDFSFGEMADQERIVAEINRQWFNQNRVLIVLIFSFLIGAILLFMLAFLVLGSAFLLYLTRKGNLTTIKTYKESVNLILNSLGVPTLLAMIFGLFYFDLYLMVTIQTIGLVIYLFYIWYKVQFNDEKLKELTE